MNEEKITKLVLTRDQTTLLLLMFLDITSNRGTEDLYKHYSPIIDELSKQVHSSRYAE